MSFNTLEIYEQDGEFSWTIKNEDIVLARCGRLHETREDALDDIFVIFFGIYDDDYMRLYSEWKANLTKAQQAKIFAGAPDQVE